MESLSAEMAVSRHANEPPHVTKASAQRRAGAPGAGKAPQHHHLTACVRVEAGPVLTALGQIKERKRNKRIYELKSK